MYRDLHVLDAPRAIQLPLAHVPAHTTPHAHIPAGIPLLHEVLEKIPSLEKFDVLLFIASSKR